MVSGVSSGIGTGIARMLARAGCDISGCGLDSEDSRGAGQFRQVVEAAGRRAEYRSLDLNRPEAIESWVQSAADTLGGIDILVSNAGRNFFEGVEGTKEASWAENLDINLAAHWRLAQKAYPHLKESAGGVVLVIASNHADYTMPGCFPYNVAKAGIKALVQSMAIEWGPLIRAVGIAPGYVLTEAGRSWFQTFPDPAAQEAKIKALHPVNKMASVDEIGALCAFLASDHAAFITGTMVLADGGRSALMQDGEGYGG